MFFVGDKVKNTMRDREGVVVLETGENEAQINSRSLSEWLMREHGVLPQKRV